MNHPTCTPGEPHRDTSTGPDVDHTGAHVTVTMET